MPTPHISALSQRTAHIYIFSWSKAPRTITWQQTLRDHANALTPPNSKDFSFMKLNILIICNGKSCGRSSTNVRGVMILGTFVEERHWRGGLIVEHFPQMSSHHNYLPASDGKIDTFFQCFLTMSDIMSLNHHLETDKCGEYSTI